MCVYRETYIYMCLFVGHKALGILMWIGIDMTGQLSIDMTHSLCSKAYNEKLLEGENHTRYFTGFGKIR